MKKKQDDRTTKQKMLRLFDNVGVKPVGRGTYGGYEFFIGDGMMKEPYPKMAKFGVEEQHFPNGCFVGLWFLAKGEEAINFGPPLFFERYDIELMKYDPSSRQKARMRAITNDAVAHIDALNDKDAKGFAFNA